MLEYDIILYPPGMGMLCVLCHPVSDFSSRDVIHIFERKNTVKYGRDQCE
jgi:hypothetical protein